MKPGLKRLIAGILLLLLAVIVPSVVIFREAVVNASSPEKRFEVPGGVKFQAKEPGRYYLWHHYGVEYEDQTFIDHTEPPAELTYEVRGEGGDVLHFIRDSSMFFHSTSDAKGSIGYVELNSPATLKVKVSGESPPTVFSISMVHPFQVLASILISFAVAAICGLLGFALGVWGIIRICTAKKSPPPVPADG